MTLLGIDVSHHQRGINLGALDVDFIIMKASEGVGYKDDLLDTFYAQARNAGKLTGLYHYARNASPANTAKEEAASFVNIVKKWIGESILILDWEDGNGVGNVTWAKEWLDEVTRLTGVRPLLYTSRSVANSYNWSGVLKDYDLWLAAYPGGLNSLKEYDYSKYNTLSAPWTVALWQYTSSGRIPGYSGNLDLNVAYMNADGWRKCATRERSDSYKEIREAAVAKARSYVGQYQFSGQCERFVRTCYGFGPLYKSANHAWRNAEGRHPGDMNPPAGVPVFWDLIGGVNDPYDHIAISIGGGEVITTSSRGSGTEIGIVSIASYTDAQAKYRGWAEVYHDTRLWPAGGEVPTPSPNPTPDPGGHIEGISVVALQRQLAVAGYYTGVIDGQAGPMTLAAILAYQKGQRYFPNLLRDGNWGPLTQGHYEWVKELQEAVNLWKTASRMGKISIDGDYGAYAAKLVGQTITDNFAGAYTQAVRAVYGHDAKPVNDGLPGPAFCHMIGIPSHPAL
ncbi:hypothetical protein FRC0024_00097 [Corynebacterium diphtheriae]|nr:hypothetical protein FRC0024_00097 [Corynebacterium diphtheriae]CAB0713850.1 hypothetical protein FRC0032_02115 [Corynebacterium diphtheriae]CAB0740399.1 hypothetical protein FRC0101_02085 [Corynebacterium diphtheriae]CAB0761552.1 hypothetical protein FRC0114_02084 [Corynebacterium diphtheriae]CAB0761570.1 hypothetical protein FRC0150_02131 [Corynebacterium diphtheriae]